MKIYYESSTASKLPARYPDNYPKEIVKGEGCYIFDKEGRKYVDFVNALGPIILGYRFPAVDEAVKKAITDCGTIFSLSHPLERKLADLLCDLLPSAEMVRFAHNGKDVTEAAIRVARYCTEREKVLSFSYHGAADVFMACTKADKGVPKCLKDTIVDFDYNDIETVQKHLEKEDVAAVILEPHTIRMPENYFLKKLRDLCNCFDTVLIFDEVVSFPRYPGYSAQALFNVMPDLTCVSKGMANGYPISALVGKEKYMSELGDGEVFFSTTFGGNLIGVSAAIATLEYMRDNDVPKHLYQIGKDFRQGITENPYIKTTGLEWRQFFECSDENRQKIWQETIKEGVFFGVPIFFNYSMSFEVIGDVCNKLNRVIARLPDIKLEGRASSEVFKKR